MTKRPQSGFSPKGFTLLEVVVIVAILVLLAGLLSPIAKNLLEDAKANKLAQLSNLLRDACMRYHLDMGTYAIEGSGTSSGWGTISQDETRHHLSIVQVSATWNGPYIDHPLGPNDNPSGLPIHVTNTLNDPGLMTGFDLKGNNQKVTGAGNMLIVPLDPSSPESSEALAKKVDEILDRSPDEPRWAGVGRVAYLKSSAKLYILLYVGP